MLNFLYLFSLLFSFNTHKQTTPKSYSDTTYVVEWSNTSIEVPLGADIYNYVYLPEAHLYIDGILYQDSNMFYERGVDHTFISVMSTSNVKTYNIHYQVTYPSLQYSNIHNITFNIVDNIPPTVVEVNPIVVPLGEKSIVYKDYIVYTDNYCDNKDIVLTILGEENIKTSVLATYTFTYQLKDKYNNVTYQNNTLTVVDNVSPNITQKKELVVGVYGELYVNSYFEIKDNYDLVLDINIDDSSVNYSVVGDYSIKITATDKSNNTTIEVFILKIRDIEAPTLVLTSIVPIINVYDEVALQNLKSYILIANDNYDNINIDNVTVAHNIDIAVIGKYDIIYSLTDTSLNVTTKTLHINVSDTVSPIITNTKELIFEVFSEEPIWSFYFSVSDNYCSVNNISLSFSEKVDMKKVALYQLVVNATDAYKNTTSELFIVNIVDSTAPILNQLSELLIFDFLKKDFTSYFEVSDNYTKKPTITFDDSLVEYDKTGEYEITVIATDDFSNTTSINTSVFVFDNELPYLKLNKTSDYISVNDNMPSFINYIKEVNDNYDFLTKENVIIEHSVTTKVVGRYEVVYKVIDSSLNYQTATLIIYIIDNTSPIIEAEDYTAIKQYSSIDILEGVSVNDPYDGDLKKKLKAYPQTIDTSKVGRHIVKYYVSDYSGNYSTFTKTFEVTPIFTFNAVTTIPFVVAFLGLSAGVVFFIRKKSR
jgi:hypothetical protein